MNLREHLQLCVRLEAGRIAAADRISAERTRLEELQTEADVFGSSVEVTNKVLMATQGQAKGFIEDVASRALSDVYGDDYGFELEYKLRAGASTATPWITKDGERYSPRDELGGGVLDICSIALRLAIWALTEPRPAGVFVLDEPAKFLSRDLQDRFGGMLVELSKSLGVQILLVSHSTAIIDQAERAFRVTQSAGVSQIEEIGT